MKVQRKQVGSTRVWVNTGSGVRVVLVPKDPIKAFRGMFKGLGLTQSLLQDRKEGLARERRGNPRKA